MEIDHDKRELRWAHPTGKVPKSVVIVGLGPTKTHLLDVTTAHVPDDGIMQADEWWGLNGGINHYGGRMRYDLVWMMDYIDGEKWKEPKYVKLVEDYLARWNVPLITSQAGSYEGNKRVHEYPLHWVYKRLGGAEPYFHNSIPYMIAYALALGVELLTLWGVDYSWDGNPAREDDKANAEYWVGFARARGVVVNIPTTSTLCQANKGWHLYGYREIPRKSVLAHLAQSDVNATLVR
jgi:hypothetical protein